MDKKYTVSGYKTRHIIPDDEYSYSLKELKEKGYHDPQRFIIIFGQQTVKVAELQKDINKHKRSPAFKILGGLIGDLLIKDDETSPSIQEATNHRS